METINHETYVSLEIAKLLKQAKFDWKCINRYIKDIDLLIPCLGETNWNDIEWEINYYISAPTLAVAQRWLREIHKYAVSVYPSDESDGWLVSIDLIEDSSSIWTKDLNNTYEEALEAGIKKALEMILNKQ